MADNKKYYYLKLKDNFYDSEQMIILQNMQDGYLYSDILMKLYLRSLKSNGKLMFNNMIPYTPQVLAQVVRHQVGTVEKALQIFKELGLIEVLDNGAIYMMDIQNFIGKSSTEADRQREYYKKIKCDEDVCKISYMKSTPEIEIEKEIELDIEKEINNTRFKKPTLEQVREYCEERNNNVNPEQFIDFYESKNWMIGKNKMKNWKACVRTWEKNHKLTKEEERQKRIEEWLKDEENRS